MNSKFYFINFAYLAVFSHLVLAQTGEPSSIFPSEKHLWKQSGPGSFEVKDGVATTKDGMGLWWYSNKSFKNATFTFQFKAATQEANSGIFVRFTDPKDDPMAAVHSGYEIQIQNSSASEINTGSIYNIQAPSHVPLKPAGEWNTYAITCFDNAIIVVLNGELVNVFKTHTNRGDKEGYFGLQNHDSNSTVSFKDIQVQEWKESDTLASISMTLGITRAAWINYWAKAPGKADWNEKTDVGPAFSSTVGDAYLGQNRVSALKGLSIELSKIDRSYAVFDKELLKVSNAGVGNLVLEGTAWDGRHGGYPSIASNNNNSILQTGTKAGWSTNKDFADPRKIQGHGNLPAEQARFLGHYRFGDTSTLAYTAGGTNILEQANLFYWNNTPALARQLELEPSDRDRWMLVTDIPQGKIKLSEDGQSASIVHQVDQTIVNPKQQQKVKIVQDRTEGTWDTLAMGAPSSKDFLQTQKNSGAYPRVIPNFATAHEKAGDEEGVAVRLVDGVLPNDSRDRSANFFFANVTTEGRIEIRFNGKTKIQRLHSYSWHNDVRSPQRYHVYYSDSDKADPKADSLQKAGWKKLVTVDTSQLGLGGKHGVALSGENNLRVPQTSVYRPTSPSRRKISHFL
jgi:hypothetical protein